MRYAMLILVAALASTLLLHFTGDRWEEYVRKGLYQLKGEKVPAESAEYVDSLGVPYVVYDSLNGVNPGKQYNPTIVALYGIRYYEGYRDGDSSLRSSLINTANWLRDHRTLKGDASLYQFNWQQPWYDSVGVPYTSGMSSGMAMQVMRYAFNTTKDSSYLRAAQSLLRGFFISVQEGGFTYKYPDGWWYEELADTAMHAPFILDGNLYAIIGVHAFMEKTHNDEAALVVRKGVDRLKNVLPLYDAGDGRIYYDRYGKLADKKYQRTIAGQMLQLYHISNDPLFLQYHNKWNAPLMRTYVLRIVEQRNVSGIILLLLLLTVFYLVFSVAVRLFNADHS